MVGHQILVLMVTLHLCVFFLLSANSTVPQTRLESLFSAISSDIFFSLSGNSTIQEIEGSFHSFITEVYYQLAMIYCLILSLCNSNVVL